MKTPYEEYKNNLLWNVIDKSIADLVENKDIVETTYREYIVGYIVKNIIKSDVLVTYAKTNISKKQEDKEK